jgi:RimJ/RimL family protein N-acetyltransferase
MSSIPSLATARLRLRAFAQTDLDVYAALCADAEVMRYIGSGGPVGRDVAWRQMALALGEWALHGHGMWALERRSDRRLIGRVGFLDPEGWPGCELAWLLARDAWGQGYAFEAAGAALAFGRDALGLDAPISLIRPDNRRSIALAERLGARFEREIEMLGATAHPYRHASGLKGRGGTPR